MTNDQLFDAVCEVLQKGHQKRPNHTPLDTLNRLFEKHLKGNAAPATNAPRLTSMNTRVSEETRSKQEFAVVGDSVIDHGDSTDPIVIVHFRGVDCLLAGHHHFNALKASGDTSMHAAYVLTVHDLG